MKILYTILFFVDVMSLMCLSFLFLQTLDNGGSAESLVLIFLGIAASILVLVLLLRKYLNR